MEDDSFEKDRIIALFFSKFNKETRFLLKKHCYFKFKFLFSVHFYEIVYYHWLISNFALSQNLHHLVINELQVL